MEAVISLYPSPSHNARTELNRFRTFYVSHETATSLVRSQVQTDSHINRTRQSSVNGVFAVGNVEDSGVWLRLRLRS